MGEPTKPAAKACGCLGEELCEQHIQVLPLAKQAAYRRRGARGTGRGRPKPPDAA